MNQMELKRREELLRQAEEEVNATGKLLQEGQISGAREMIGFFEKLAFFDGGAATLVITFTASTKKSLTPVWGFKAGLLLLLFGVIAAMLRNWLYFHYVAAVRNADYYEARAKEQSARAGLYEVAPATISLQDGKPLDPVKFKADIKESNSGIRSKVDELRMSERRSWRGNVWSGNLAQIFTAMALMLLAYVAIRSL